MSNVVFISGFRCGEGDKEANPVWEEKEDGEIFLIFFF